MGAKANNCIASSTVTKNALTSTFGPAINNNYPTPPQQYPDNNRSVIISNGIKFQRDQDSNTRVPMQVSRAPPESRQPAPIGVSVITGPWRDSSVISPSLPRRSPSPLKKDTLQQHTFVTPSPPPRLQYPSRTPSVIQNFHGQQPKQPERKFFGIKNPASAPNKPAVSVIISSSSNTVNNNYSAPTSAPVYTKTSNSSKEPSSASNAKPHPVIISHQSHSQNTSASNIIRNRIAPSSGSSYPVVTTVRGTDLGFKSKTSTFPSESSVISVASSYIKPQTSLTVSESGVLHNSSYLTGKTEVIKSNPQAFELQKGVSYNRVEANKSNNEQGYQENNAPPEINEQRPVYNTDIPLQFQAYRGYRTDDAYYAKHRHFASPNKYVLQEHSYWAKPPSPNEVPSKNVDTGSNKTSVITSPIKNQVLNNRPSVLSSSSASNANRIASNSCSIIDTINSVVNACTSNVSIHQNNDDDPVAVNASRNISVISRNSNIPNNVQNINKYSSSVNNHNTNPNNIINNQRYQTNNSHNSNSISNHHIVNNSPGVITYNSSKKSINPPSVDVCKTDKTSTDKINNRIVVEHKTISSIFREEHDLSDDETTEDFFREERGEKQEEESVTRCVCGFQHDDGYMISCDRCLVWQHVDCMEINKSKIPEEYQCELCQPRFINKERAISIQKIKIANNLLAGTNTDSDSSESAHRGMEKSRTKIGSSRKSQKRKNKIDSKESLSKNNQQSQKMGTTSSVSDERKQHLIQEKKNNTLPNRKESSKNQTMRNAFSIKNNQDKNKDDVQLKDSNRINESRVVDNVKSSSVHQLRQWIDNYEEAVTNHYSQELRARIGAVKVNGIHSDRLVGALPALSKCRVSMLASGVKILLTTSNLSINQPIVELRGKYMLKKSNISPALAYVFFYRIPNEDIEVCVDCRTYGNDARFVRRSCKPNAAIRHCIEKGVVRLYLISLRHLDKNTELLIGHYNHETVKNCSCGSPKDCIAIKQYSLQHCTKVNQPNLKQPQQQQGAKSSQVNSPAKPSLQHIPNNSKIPSARKPRQQDDTNKNFVSRSHSPIPVDRKLPPISTIAQKKPSKPTQNKKMVLTEVKPNIRSVLSTSSSSSRNSRSRSISSSRSSCRSRRSCSSASSCSSSSNHSRSSNSSSSSSVESPPRYIPGNRPKPSNTANVVRRKSITPERKISITQHAQSRSKTPCSELHQTASVRHGRSPVRPVLPTRTVRSPVRTVSCLRKAMSPVRAVSCSRKARSPVRAVSCSRKARSPVRAVSCSRKARSPVRAVSCTRKARSPVRTTLHHLKNDRLSPLSVRQELLESDWSRSSRPNAKGSSSRARSQPPTNRRQSTCNNLVLAGGAKQDNSRTSLPAKTKAKRSLSIAPRRRRSSTKDETPTTPTTTNTTNNKMTREEKKILAYVKAFEQLEKKSAKMQLKKGSDSTQKRKGRKSESKKSESQDESNETEPEIKKSKLDLGQKSPVKEPNNLELSKDDEKTLATVKNDKKPETTVPVTIGNETSGRIDGDHSASDTVITSEKFDELILHFNSAPPTPTFELPDRDIEQEEPFIENEKLKSSTSLVHSYPNSLQTSNNNLSRPPSPKIDLDGDYLKVESVMRKNFVLESSKSEKIVKSLEDVVELKLSKIGEPVLKSNNIIGESKSDKTAELIKNDSIIKNSLIIDKSPTQRSSMNELSIDHMQSNSNQFSNEILSESNSFSVQNKKSATQDNEPVIDAEEKKKERAPTPSISPIPFDDKPVSRNQNFEKDDSKNVDAADEQETGVSKATHKKTTRGRGKSRSRSVIPNKRSRSVIPNKCKKSNPGDDTADSRHTPPDSPKENYSKDDTPSKKGKREKTKKSCTDLVNNVSARTRSAAKKLEEEAAAALQGGTYFSKFPFSKSGDKVGIYTDDDDDDEPFQSRLSRRSKKFKDGRFCGITLSTSDDNVLKTSAIGSLIGGDFRFPQSKQELLNAWYMEETKPEDDGNSLAKKCTVESNSGYLKKRWLRKAIQEDPSTVAQPDDTASSPVAVRSPIAQPHIPEEPLSIVAVAQPTIVPMQEEPTTVTREEVVPSAELKGDDNFQTGESKGDGEYIGPFKKRRLARESVSSDQSCTSPSLNIIPPTFTQMPLEDDEEDVHIEGSNTEGASGGFGSCNAGMNTSLQDQPYFDHHLNNSISKDGNADTINDSVEDNRLYGIRKANMRYYEAMKKTELTPPDQALSSTTSVLPTETPTQVVVTSSTRIQTPSSRIQTSPTTIQTSPPRIQTSPPATTEVILTVIDLDLDSIDLPPSDTATTSAATLMSSPPAVVTQTSNTDADIEIIELPTDPMTTFASSQPSFIGTGSGSSLTSNTVTESLPIAVEALNIPLPVDSNSTTALPNSTAALPAAVKMTPNYEKIKKPPMKVNILDEIDLTNDADDDDDYPTRKKLSISEYQMRNGGCSSGAYYDEQDLQYGNDSRPSVRMTHVDYFTSSSTSSTSSSDNEQDDTTDMEGNSAKLIEASLRLERKLAYNSSRVNRNGPISEVLLSADSIIENYTLTNNNNDVHNNIDTIKVENSDYTVPEFEPERENLTERLRREFGLNCVDEDSLCNPPPPPEESPPPPLLPLTVSTTKRIHVRDSRRRADDEFLDPLPSSTLKSRIRNRAAAASGYPVRSSAGTRHHPSSHCQSAPMLNTNFPPPPPPPPPSAEQRPLHSPLPGQQMPYCRMSQQHASPHRSSQQYSSYEHHAHAHLSSHHQYDPNRRQRQRSRNTESSCNPPLPRDPPRFSLTHLLSLTEPPKLQKPNFFPFPVPYLQPPPPPPLPNDPYPGDDYY